MPSLPDPGAIAARFSVRYLERAALALRLQQSAVALRVMRTVEEIAELAQLVPVEMEPTIPLWLEVSGLRAGYIVDRDRREVVVTRVDAAETRPGG